MEYPEQATGHYDDVIRIRHSECFIRVQSEFRLIPAKNMRE